MPELMLALETLSVWRAILAAAMAMDRALTPFGGSYAEQTEGDHATFAAAVKDGRLQAA